MKQIAILFLFTFSVLSLSAQTEKKAKSAGEEVLQPIDSIENMFDATVDACIAMRDAVANNDSIGIKKSADELRACKTSDFYSLHNQEDEEPSLNGHLVFDEVFADSLAEGKEVYQKADDFNRTRSDRGQTSDGSIKTKSCFAKAGQTVRYFFYATKHQKIAVVAEAGGLVTMKIHVTNSAGLNIKRNDTKNVNKGQPQRRASFDLPEHPRSKVEVEIINCGEKDCSFVVISN